MFHNQKQHTRFKWLGSKSLRELKPGKPNLLDCQAEKIIESYKLSIHRKCFQKVVVCISFRIQHNDLFCILCQISLHVKNLSAVLSCTGRGSSVFRFQPKHLRRQSGQIYISVSLDLCAM